jgi:hypothetical protein
LIKEITFGAKNLLQKRLQGSEDAEADSTSQHQHPEGPVCQQFFQSSLERLLQINSMIRGTLNE